ncbi:hypothetical protein AAJCM20276_17440 [Acetobacter aceti]|uniref:Uncharacterized protein n=1 Tax=Acetobacter aceti TaxID=435 RepID=A0A6S6PJF4_ACEAC|nr:hypothetical protein AAJCM20276_17440 [Acetobacter aceti]
MVEEDESACWSAAFIARRMSRLSLAVSGRSPEPVMESEKLCGATLAVGLYNLQDLLVQVGAGIP